MKPLPVAKRLDLLETDQQQLRESFSYIKGEFKALKLIATSLWLPALAGLGVELYHILFKG